jgi:hypothetical protein
VPGKKGIAFVEFESEPLATGALMGLNKFKLTPEHTLALSYARR